MSNLSPASPWATAILNPQAASHVDRPAGPPVAVGRRRDPTRDADILDATVDVMADVGHERITVDAVAGRAEAVNATVYRRRSSKEELIIAAVTRQKRAQADLDHLPDTGTLRGNLLALHRPESTAARAYKLRVSAALAAVIASHPTFADAVNAMMTQPWATAHRTLIERAVARGEIATPPDITVSLVDGLLLPALGITSDKRAP